MNKEQLGEELRSIADEGIADFKKSHPGHNISVWYSHARVFEIPYMTGSGVCWDCRQAWTSLPGLNEER